MKDNSLRDIEKRRLAVNRRIGVYSLWLISLGVVFALFFFGGGMEPEKRWALLSLVVLYVAVRLVLMRYRANRRDG